MEWMILPLKRYVDFKGRSRRMEFWMFALMNLIVSGILLTLMFIGGFGPEQLAGLEAGATPDFGITFYIGAGLMVLWSLAILIPGIAVTVRRLHDRNMSGWWYLGILIASFIPFVGMLVSLGYLVLMVLPGTEGPNRFGSDPKGDGADATVFE